MISEKTAQVEPKMGESVSGLALLPSPVPALLPLPPPLPPEPQRWRRRRILCAQNLATRASP